jgi:Periplasmic binding protein
VSNPVLTLALMPPSVSSLRIVSLVPSVTELLADVGLAAFLVGRTGFCVHPAHLVGDIAKVGGTKAVNVDKIRSLDPTHVVVNVDENEKPTIELLAQWVPHIVVTHPCSPADNLGLIDQLVREFSPALAHQPGALTGMQQQAIALKKQLSQRLEALHNAPSMHAHCRVLYLIWRDPWMTVANDTYISRMLALIGWQTLPAVMGGDGVHTPGAARYPVLQGNEPWLANVQRVLLSSEPYSFNVKHLHEVRKWLPHAIVQLVDGEMLSWYGSRAVQGLDYLAALVAGVSTEAAAGEDNDAAASTSPE